LILPVKGICCGWFRKADEETTHAGAGMGEVTKAGPKLVESLQPWAQALKDRGASNTVGLEEQVKFSVFDGLRKAAPKLEFVSGTPVTGGLPVGQIAGRAGSDAAC